MQLKKSDDVLFWCGVILLILGIGSVASAQDSLNRWQYDSICQLTIPNKGQGSGALISVREDLRMGLILSCRHVCVRPGQPLRADWFRQGVGGYEGHTLAVLPGNGLDNDLAIAVVHTPPGIRPLKVAAFNPVNGPWVGAGYRADTLRVAQPVYMFQYNGGAIATQNVWVNGMSGGPLFDKHGEIVGVVVATDHKQLSLSSDGPALHELVNRFLAAKTVNEVYSWNNPQISQ